MRGPAAPCPDHRPKPSNLASTDYPRPWLNFQNSTSIKGHPLDTQQWNIRKGLVK